ncbi:MAG: hypothetical protein K2I10_00485 [Lachnospiraceae bacterium]|nr:hypothetical protein [Lachnospiraceae bacterium]
MNAKTFTDTVKPVLAIVAVPKYKRQHQHKQQKGKAKKPINSLFQTALGTETQEPEMIPTGCYGKDAKPVVRNVCHFHAAM